MNIWIQNLAVIIYIAATVSQMIFLVSQKPGMGRMANYITVGAFILHTVSLFVRFFEAGYTPVTSLYESFNFFGWCVVGIYLGLQLRYNVPSLGAFVTPIALVLLLGSASSHKEITELAPALQSFWLPLHVIMLFVGNGAFALSATAGVMYLIQERQLKRKKFGGMFHRLPNIDVLDEINYRCLTIGFPLLTVGIITGAAWAQNAWGTYWSWDPKETWSLITWFLYAGILHGRLTVGWRGKIAAIWSIIGFASVIFTFLGVNYVLPHILPDIKSLHIYTGGSN